MRTTIDRVLAVVARFVLRGFYRRLEVAGRDRVPTDRPVLLVANHFNGFVDPVVLTAAFGRVPRFLAKATLWKVVAARPFLALAGIIPVHRAEDGSTEGNDRTFSACYHALGRAATVAIFPEGTTHDDPYLHRLHTGAARIALGARAAGVVGVTIVPVGLVFSDKLALRSRVAVRVGRPIDVDTVLLAAAGAGGAVAPASAGRTSAAGDDPAPDREEVDALTDLILERLSAVAGDYAEWREASHARRAAEIALRSAEPGRRLVPLAEREALAQQIADADPEDRDRVFHALGRYALDLDQVGLDDDQLVPRLDLPRVAWQLALSLIGLLLLGPLVVTGVTVNAAPYAIVRVVGSSVRAPVTKGTVRLLLALVCFPVAWAVFAWINRVDDPFVWEMLVAAACGGATVWLFEQWVRLYRTWRAFDVQRNSQRLVEWILPDREALVDAVYDTVGTQNVALARHGRA
jgi:1-acyl-sn-glycerol-3-phosphate acyltransferase